MLRSTEQQGWNFADVFEALSDRQPDALAQRFGGASTTWSEFDRRDTELRASCSQTARSFGDRLTSPSFQPRSSAMILPSIFRWTSRRS